MAKEMQSRSNSSSANDKLQRALLCLSRGRQEVSPCNIFLMH